MYIYFGRKIYTNYLPSESVLMLERSSVESFNNTSNWPKPIVLAILKPLSAQENCGMVGVKAIVHPNVLSHLT